MNPKPTFQSLPLDCLLEIFQYVPLPECLFLRSSCASLKHAVDEHFRTKVQTLPVMLSDHYSAESVDKYQQYCENDNTSCYQQISFGSTSGVSQWNLWEDEKMLHLDRVRHFRRDNYMILTDMTKFGVFVDFVTKYLPKITKLALVIDHPDHAHNIPEVLSIYRKQLKVLLLERTLRATLMFDNRCDDVEQAVSGRKFHFTGELYDSVVGLEALEELYFFTKSHDTFNLDWNRNSNDHRFVESMLCKLRILHLNCDGVGQSSPFRLRSRVYEKLEELACYSSYSFKENNVSFPRLEKFIFFEIHSPIHSLLNSNIAPNLKDISLPNVWLSFYGNEINTLNSLPNLRRLHIHGMHLGYISGIQKFKMSVQTVEHIEIDKLFEDPKVETLPYSMKAAMGFALDFLGFFPNLKKAVIREPFMELAANDLPLNETEDEYMYRRIDKFFEGFE